MADPGNRMSVEETHAALIEWDGVIRTIAWKWYRKNSNLVSLEELYQECVLGFLDAAPRFDKTRGVKFGSYAQWYANDRARKLVQQTAGFGMVRRRPGGKILYAPLEKTGVGRRERSRLDDCCGSEERATPNMSRDELWGLIRSLLTDREFFVVHARFVVGQTLAEVGLALGLSRQGVARIQGKALCRLAVHPGVSGWFGQEPARGDPW